MFVVGIVEMIADLVIWFYPRIFAYAVSAWLFLIVVNLLLIPGFFDGALRD
jgi:hypothetical protein